MQGLKLYVFFSFCNKNCNKKNTSTTSFLQYDNYITYDEYFIFYFYLLYIYRFMHCIFIEKKRNQFKAKTPAYYLDVNKNNLQNKIEKQNIQ